MKLSLETIREWKLAISAQVNSEYDRYVASWTSSRRGKSNAEPPMDWDDFQKRRSVAQYMSHNAWLALLAAAELGIQYAEGQIKVDGPLTADQKNDYVARYMSESVGEVGNGREQVYSPLRGYGPRLNDLSKPTESKPANLITSKTEKDNIHLPCFDIDMPCRLVPSKTPGHYHLLIEKEMTWENYQLMLNALAIVGVVEQGYVEASRNLGRTAIRVGPEELVAQEIMQDVKMREFAVIFTEDDEGAEILPEDMSAEPEKLVPEGVKRSLGGVEGLDF